MTSGWCIWDWLKIVINYNAHVHCTELDSTIKLCEFNFQILSDFNALLMVWLGLGTKTTWSGLGKHHILAKNGLGLGFWLSQTRLEMAQVIVRNFNFLFLQQSPLFKTVQNHWELLTICQGYLGTLLAATKPAKLNLKKPKFATKNCKF